MNEDLLVTIAISTYNVEKYIEKAMMTILNQTYTNFEFICIDDGSYDSTVDILNKYKERDKRIKLILKDQNFGLSVSRNDALKLANGKYIWFIDGDDFYDCNTLKYAIESSNNGEKDIIIWDYYTFYDELVLENTELHLQNLKLTDYNLILNIPSFTPIKLIKTEYARKLDIIFPIGRTRQDIPVHWKLITNKPSIAIINKKLFYYRQHKSATTHQNNEKLFDLAYVMDIVEKQLHDDLIFDKYKDIFYKKRLELLHGMYDAINNNLKSQAVDLIDQRLNNDYYKYIKSKDCRISFIIRCFYLGYNKINIYTLLYYIWKLTRSSYRLLKKII